MVRETLAGENSTEMELRLWKRSRRRTDHAMLQPLTTLVNRVVWEGSPTRARNAPGDLEPFVGSSAPETKRTDNHAPDVLVGGDALSGKGQISTRLLYNFRLRRCGLVFEAHIEINEFPLKLCFKILKTGLRQGDGLPLLLFNVVLD